MVSKDVREQVKWLCLFFTTDPDSFEDCLRENVVIPHRNEKEFLDKNNILYKYQSGFRNHHSTDTCLSYLTDKVKIGFEEGLLTGMVLIDLQKAFDTIDHSIL